MGATGPGTQQAQHKYFTNEHARQRAFPELLPRSAPFRAEARPAGRTIWLLGEPAWGLQGNAEELNHGGHCAALGSGRKRWWTVSCLDYSCFN